MKDKLIVVTGAGGFIGGNLIASFRQQGNRTYPGSRHETAGELVSEDLTMSRTSRLI